MNVPSRQWLEIKTKIKTAISGRGFCQHVFSIDVRFSTFSALRRQGSGGSFFKRAQNAHTARTKRAHGSHKTRTRLAQNAHTTRTKRAHGSHKTRTNWSGLNIQKSAPCDSWPYCLILYIMEYQFFRILKFYQFLPYRLLILSIESGRVSVRTICCMSESTGFQIVNWSYYAVRFQFGICAVRFGFSSVSVRYLCDPVRF